MPDIIIAISGYKSDAAVIARLQAIQADPPRQSYAVLVVDSASSGAIARYIAQNKMDVHCESRSDNPGSAGNLARRIALACESNAQWCYCLNHDAPWSAQRLKAQLNSAITAGDIAAVYPLLDHSPRQPRWETARQSFRPVAGARIADIAMLQSDRPTLWGSSNGALYNLAAFRQGVQVMDGLWMGYEDLAIGIALSQRGWRQVFCQAAQLSGIFDYQSRRLMGRDMAIPDKPVWYMFYNIRNLILIRKAFGGEGVKYRWIWRKLLQSVLRILLLEDQKFTRLQLLLQGTLAGLRNQNGKGQLP